MKTPNDKLHIARTMIAPLLVALVVNTPAVVADVTYLGAITEKLHAPTALHVSADALVALEPYSQELALYTPDGFALERIQISGWVTGLQRLDAGRYLFCDRKLGEVALLDVVSHSQTSFLGSAAGVDPTDLLVLDDRVYLLDALNGALNHYDPQGALVSSASLVDDSGLSIGFPSSLTFDQLTERFFVLDQNTSEIWILDSTGGFISKFSSFGRGQGEISRGGVIRCDRQGLVYVSDRYQGRIVVFSPFGEFITNIELGEFGSDRLATPIGLTLDENDILYVASTESASIHMFKVSGYAGGATALRLKPLLPVDGATITAGTVVFRAESYTVSDLIGPGVFDFEVFSGSDSSAPVFSAESVKPSDSLSAESGTLVGEWYPSGNFASDSLYHWRARLRNAAFTGPWMSLQSFTVSALPHKFSLSQNYPNPFNPSTKIAFTLAHDAHVSITVINLLGQKVVTLVSDELSAGENLVVWDGLNSSGSAAASGVYFYRMVTAEFVETKKMVLVK